ncbi:MAG TPA: Slp family lipoprotein [bacterium]|jgi:starvation-inducible outer membrane lipoprotein
MLVTIPMPLRLPLLILVLAAVLSFTACATPRPPREVLEPLPPAAALERDPESYRDHAFVFAGEIVSLLQTGDRTLIEVELVTIDHRGRPRSPRQSGGRVFLHSPETLRATDYLPGRGMIGVVRFTGLAEAAVDGETASFPLLDLLKHRLVRDLSGGGRPRFEFGLGVGFGL